MGKQAGVGRNRVWGGRVGLQVGKRTVRANGIQVRQSESVANPRQSQVGSVTRVRVACFVDGDWQTKHLN